MEKRIVWLALCFLLWMAPVNAFADEHAVSNHWLIIAVEDLSFAELRRLADESENWRELFEQSALASMSLRTLVGREREALNWTIAGGMRNAGIEKVHFEFEWEAWDDVGSEYSARRACLSSGRPRLDVVTLGDVLMQTGHTAAWVPLDEAVFLPALWLMSSTRCLRVYDARAAYEEPSDDVLLLTVKAQTETWQKLAEALPDRIERARQAGREVMLLGTTPVTGEGHAVPLLWWRSSPGAGEGGYLTSPTTRWPGIVAAVDLLPTWLASYQAVSVWEKLAEHDAHPPYLEGAPIEEVPVEADSRLALIEHLFILHRLRPAVLNGYLKVTTFALVLSAVHRLLPRPYRMTLLSYVLRFLAVYALIGPVALLFLGALWGAGVLPPDRWSTPAPYTGFILMSALVFFLLWLRLGTHRVFIVYSFTLALLLIGNELQGGSWVRYSVFGYDPFIGARYYGLGNELMGLVSGLGMLIIGMLKNMHAHPLAPFTLYGMIFVYLAAPFLGSNFGGTLAWLMLLPYARVTPERLHGLSTRHFSRRPLTLFGSMLALFSIMLALLTLFILWHHGLQTEPTHLTRLMDRLFAHGLSPLWEIAFRKWQMNWKLVQYSTYSTVFLVSFLISIAYRVWLLWRKKVRHTVFDGVLGVSLVNFFVNDSGVVAAAMGLLFFAFPLLVCWEMQDMRECSRTRL
ncbi:MAG: hypothetical protein BSOLF_0599 [Candidatus Carbobacillus altaicus]|uniref:Uncharacterized protein n=1 Tax=Candidatus Carbonibacillus altaicus TaxID=2163959 RepID=A0A2R6Y0Q3_9BACL|nr:MAG: hypothetical protein BSOLF_0599 [Candidatus Carbobacillus altaicus]